MMPAQDRFDELFRANYRDVLAYAVRRCPSRADAEDVVAETFAVAWRRIEDIPPSDRARPWLFGTARLVRMNSRRTHRRQQRLLERLRSSFVPVAQRGADRQISEQDRLARAMAQLSPLEREVLRLRAWEQLSDAQIAEALDVGLASAKKRLQRARARLAAALAESDAGDNRTYVAQPAEEAAR